MCSQTCSNSNNNSSSSVVITKSSQTWSHSRDSFPELDAKSSKGVTCRQTRNMRVLRATMLDLRCRRITMTLTIWVKTSM
jgi:hypothetical protein